MRWVVAAAATAALVLGLALYVRVGWSRMETTCASDLPGARSHGSASYSWQWTPTGFTCSYDDGTSETSLWF